MQVVVLAGGQGTRLRPWTLTRPKSGLMLLDRPLLAHVLDLLPTDAITSVLVAAGYLVDDLRAILDEHQLPWPVMVIEEEEPLGTGGALHNLLDGRGGAQRVGEEGGEELRAARRALGRVRRRLLA